MEESFLDNLLNNPADGTFLAWISDGGLWAILIALGAIIGWWLVRRFLRRSLRQAIRGLDQHDATADVGMAVQAADSWISNFMVAAVFGVAATLGILSVLGSNIDPAINFLKDAGATTGSWFATDGVRILMILFLSWVVTRIARRVIPRALSSIMLGQASTADHDEVMKRSETLSSVFVGVAVSLIYVSALFMVLTELSVPIGPVLGGFGIAGIAVGFGAQYLVRDLIAGIFILAENQYRTGDVVTIAGISGLVESINLRRTVLRDLDGQVHVIPNGEITVASNKTKYWSRVHLDIGVAYKEDVDQVIALLNEIGDEIAADPYFGLMLITPPQVLRLNSLDDSAVTFKMLGDCKPMKQWEIMGEMRRRIKIRFDAEGIEIPFPHQTVYWGEGQVPLQWDAERMASYRKAAEPDLDLAAPEAEPEPARPAAPPKREPALAAAGVRTGAGRPEPEARPDIPMTPERREEMLAAIAIATSARVGDADSEVRLRTQIVDTSDDE
ncbi:MAG: mechanosensitive ion channel family protein [Chloroflexi bacterium]|nr:mechanosensitive ion channel family protein [Chloroflexota bacterium]